MEHVEETVEVAVPLRTAYNQWTQFESFPQFMSGVESVTQLTDTTNHWVTKVGGVQREFDTEIVDQEPDDRIAWRSTDGKSHAGIIRFTPLDANHTKVRVHFEWAPETLTEKAGAALKMDQMQVNLTCASSRTSSNRAVPKPAAGAAKSRTPDPPGSSRSAGRGRLRKRRLANGKRTTAGLPAVVRSFQALGT